MAGRVPTGLHPALRWWPDFAAHEADEFVLQRVHVLVDAGHRRDEGIDALALDVVREAHDGSFGHRFVPGTSALSTSAVPMRWPETLITSSTRPVIQ